jgi:hypothetical protein
MLQDELERTANQDHLEEDGLDDVDPDPDVDDLDDEPLDLALDQITELEVRLAKIEDGMPEVRADNEPVVGGQTHAEIASARECGEA